MLYVAQGKDILQQNYYMSAMWNEVYMYKVFVDYYTAIATWICRTLILQILLLGAGQYNHTRHYYFTGTVQIK